MRRLPTEDEIKQELWVDYNQTTAKKSAKTKAKEPHVNRDIFIILPFSEPRKHDCGQFLDYNISHVSVVPDLPNENGELEHSIHPQKARRVNCNSITCEVCNFKRDSNGNFELDGEGNRIPDGAYESTIFYQEQKIQKFQDQSYGIIKSQPYPENFRELHRLFYSRHRTNHASGVVFYTLVDKKNGPEAASQS